MLSKKYYKKIAEIFGKTNANVDTIIEFENMALEDNPRFDSIRFNEAVQKEKLKSVS
jgi:hypothetical protein